MKLLPLILIAIFTESLGGTLLSRGMKQVGQIIEAGEVVLSSPIALDSLMSIYPPLAYYVGIVLLTVTNVSFLSGLALQITFFLLFLTLLSKADLSYVLPVTSFSYVITAALAIWILQENVSRGRWFGIALICTGVLLVVQGESRTTPAAASSAVNSTVNIESTELVAASVKESGKVGHLVSSLEANQPLATATNLAHEAKARESTTAQRPNTTQAQVEEPPQA